MSGPTRKPLAERFWPKVDQSGGPGACWPWTGSRDPKGYGRITRPGRSTNVSPFFAHRVAYALHRGLDPADLDTVVRHSCDNPPCCNPKHLLDGTHADNHADAAARGRAWWQHGVRLRDALGRLTSDPLQRSAR